MEIVWADTSTYTPDGIATLVGHVHLKEGNTHFHADRVVYDENTKKGDALRDPYVKGGSIGDPVVQDERDALTADRFLLDFSPKDARQKVVSAVGHVRFVAKPKPDEAPSESATRGSAPSGGAASGPAASGGSSGPAPAKGKDAASDEKRARLEKRVKQETVLTCDRLDYYYRSRRAVAEGDLKVVQGKRWLTGDQAIYYDRYDTVVVNGNVKGEDEKGRTFAADNLKVVLSGDSETIEASQFHGTFALDEETDSDASEPAPPPLPGSDAAPQPASAPGAPR